MSNIELVGHLGSLLSSVTFIPQVYKTWKSKSASDLSLLMMGIVFSSTIVWLIYGIGLDLLPVIICNSVNCALSLLLIFFKLAFKSNPTIPK